MSKHTIGYSSVIILAVFYSIVFIYWNDAPIYPLFILLFCWLVVVMCGSLFIRFRFHIPIVLSIKTDEKKIAITFDDGPTEHTDGILHLLKKHNQKATFFCIGKQLDKFPGIAKKIVEQGHDIGNHTFSHSYSMGFKSKIEITNEIIQTDQLIQQITGSKPRYFRPPFGVTNPSIRKALHITKHLPIGWNVRSLDTVIRNTEKLINRIMKRILPGCIILLHDTNQNTVTALERLLVELDKKNYKSKTLTELLKLSQ